jgi:hypothetical protein
MISTGRSWTFATVPGWARNLVERRVAAADDDHVVPGEVVEVRHEEHDSGTGEGVRGRQRPGGEAAQPAGHQDRSTVEGGTVAERQHRLVVHIGQRVGPHPEQVLGRGRRGLLDEVGDEVPPPDHREAGDVVDELLRVHRGHLAARLGQRVDDHGGQPAEPGIVRGEQPGGTGTYDCHIHLAHFALTAVSPSVTSDQLLVRP